MEIKHKKVPGLFTFFLRYLILFCAANILVAIVIISCYLYGLMSRAILPANDAEQKLRQMEVNMKNGQSFQPQSIPFTCSYALFDNHQNFISGNMSESEIEDSIKILLQDSETVRGFYFPIVQENSSIVIRYDMYPHFASPTLHRLFPNPEVLLLLLFLLSFIILTILIAMKFGKKLNKQITPLITATEAIKCQELNFIIKPTGVREFNNVLDSIDDMRAALKASLEQQWNAEQSRRTQTAALTHDIKTPLTLVKGNSELLLETELAEEETEMAETIRRSAEKIEQYIALLMNMATAENPMIFQAETFPFDGLLKEITAHAEAVCQVKHISLEVQNMRLPECFYGDRMLIFRGIMNILDNAAEYSPDNSKISLITDQSDEFLIFKVADSGKGFSPAGLKQAAEPFYTGQQERSGKHYGLGLFLAKSAAEKHGGRLIIENLENDKGAIVTMMLRGIKS